MAPVTPDDVRRHITVLTRDIGVRLAGSRGEQQAAGYVAATATWPRPWSSSARP
ncbi:MAG: hypothetical protein MUF60_10620 [Vicinamibacterales bacterium]|nr:hypothetical protein [Vicinamibacterales bacterium]